MGLQGAVSFGLLLAGAWTILAAFTVAAGRERSYYVGWGIILAGLSSSYYIPVQDALGLILVAIVGLVVLTAYFARAPSAKPGAEGPSDRGAAPPAS